MRLRAKLLSNFLRNIGRIQSLLIRHIFVQRSLITTSKQKQIIIKKHLTLEYKNIIIYPYSVERLNIPILLWWYLCSSYELLLFVCDL